MRLRIVDARLVAARRQPPGSTWSRPGSGVRLVLTGGGRRRNPGVGVVGSLKSLGKTVGRARGEAVQKCVLGYHKGEGVGLAGPEGALFPSVGAPAGRLAVCRQYIEPARVPVL